MRLNGNMLSSVGRGGQASEHSRSAGEEGFVLPMVIFAMVLLIAIAVATLSTSADERMAGRALRESAKAFYAAEAGLNAAISGWDQAAYDTLLATPGDSLALSWQTLDNGSSYGAVVHRVDGGSGTRLYTITVVGRGVGGLRGQRILRVILRATEGSGEFEGVGAIQGRGSLRTENNNLIDGNDTIPPWYHWGQGDQCSADRTDNPAVVWDDTSQVEQIPPADLYGNPPIAEDTTINDETFSQYGGLTWDELKSKADKVIDATSGITSPIEPSDVSGFGSACDTSDPWNWGNWNDNPDCRDYLPIIYVKGDLTLTGGSSYGQGIVLVDGGDGNTAGRLSIRNGVVFNGIILVKGCLDLDNAGRIYGTMSVDGSVEGPNCSSMAYDVHIRNAGRYYWSSCVAEYTWGQAVGGPRTARPLSSGAWSQVIN